MAARRELDEAAAPDGLVAERLGVEAGGRARRVAQPDADALGHGHPRAAEDAAEDVPRSVWFQRPSAQVVLVLVAPVALRCRRRGRGTGAGAAGRAAACAKYSASLA